MGERSLYLNAFKGLVVRCKELHSKFCGLLNESFQLWKLIAFVHPKPIWVSSKLFNLWSLITYKPSRVRIDKYIIGSKFQRRLHNAAADALN